MKFIKTQSTKDLVILNRSDCPETIIIDKHIFQGSYHAFRWSKSEHNTYFDKYLEDDHGIILGVPPYSVTKMKYIEKYE